VPATRERPLEIVVAHTNPAATAQALEAAAELARGFDVAVNLMAVRVLPYPWALECPEGIRKRLEAEVTAIARTSDTEVSVDLVFARDWENAYLGLLERGQMVVIGAKDRWWRTREQRLARKLTMAGHSVAIVKVS
jgi:hypothetical protein